MFTIPIHPALVHFPLAMLTTAWVCVLLWHRTGSIVWDDRARLFEFVGVVGLPLVILSGGVSAGLATFTEPAWDQPLIWHAITAVLGSLVFTVHWWWRRDLVPEHLGRVRTARLDVVGSSVGFWLYVTTGLLAGEVVYG